MGLVKCLKAPYLSGSCRGKSIESLLVEGQPKGALYINKVSLFLVGDGFCFTGRANLVPSTYLGHAALSSPRNPRASRDSIPVTGFDIQGSL